MRFNFKRKALVGVACATAMFTTIAGPASAAPTEPTVIADTLNSPSGISYGPAGLFVTESSKGQVTQINPETGEKRAVATGLNTPTSVTPVRNKLAIVTGAVEDPTADKTGSSSVYLLSPGGQPKLLVDLLKYELEHNVDGQLQYDPTTKMPLDSLSNPFDVISGKGRAYLFVADAGGNAVYTISRKGEVHPFFLPPLVTNGTCTGAENNDPQHVGCDPVPTGLAYGPDGDLYVSTLGALHPGAGKVYRLNSYTGEVKGVLEGLDAPSGITVDKWGNVYTSEVTYGSPPLPEPGQEETAPPPPANFDFATVGRIVKTDTDGNRTYVHVTMPVGLDFYRGALYATAWSTAEEFLKLKDKGQVVKLSPRDFTTPVVNEPPVLTAPAPS